MLKFKIFWEAFRLYCRVLALQGVTSVSSTSLCDVERLIKSEQETGKLRGGGRGLLTAAVPVPITLSWEVGNDENHEIYWREETVWRILT